MSINSDFKIEDGVLIHYNGSDDEVVIPDGVTQKPRSFFFQKITILPLSCNKYRLFAVNIPIL